MDMLKRGHFHIVHGPNLNLLGVRQPEIYGSLGFDAVLVSLRQQFADHQIDYFQSNHEGALVDYLQQVGFSSDGILLNAAAYTHTSVAIADAVAAIRSRVVEVHISNPYSREPFRHQSLISAYAVAVLAGMGMDGYFLALQFLTGSVPKANL